MTARHLARLTERKAKNSMANTKSYRKLLDNGGELFVNKMDSHYSVDVFAWDYQSGDEPIYHAFYDNEADAMADAESWKPWPEQH